MKNKILEILKNIDPEKKLSRVDFEIALFEKMIDLESFDPSKRVCLCGFSYDDCNNQQWKTVKEVFSESN